jgi:phosphoglycerate kinase
MLDQLLENPKRPYIAIMGGAKVSDKIDVIEKMMNLVDGFIIGGAMAYTFLKAKGLPVGKSLVEADKVSYAREMMNRIEARQKTLLLPVDHMVTNDIASNKATATSGQGIDEGMMGVDIGPLTIRNYSKAISEAQTVFWNGPMGIFENPAYAQGTFAVAKALAESKGNKIVGGGDSAAAAEASGYASQMTHISTGGGASLEYLQGDRLPGLEVLRPPKTSEKMP